MIKENVILLHGLGRSYRSMSHLGSILESHNYHVINIDYDSRSATIEVLSEIVISKALLQCKKDGAIHFVTHSLGGILVRHYLTNHKIERLHRVVMLGPPNGGSEIVDYLSGIPGFKLINGEAGDQLATTNNELIQSLGPADYELGIIAGTSSLNPIYSAMLPGEDDGKVTVASTKMLGMSDHITLPVTHTFMMRNPLVIEQTLHFLSTGKFASTPNDTPD